MKYFLGCIGLLLFTYCLISMKIPEDQPTLHLIMVADTQSVKIKEGVSRDIVHVRKRFNTIARLLNYDLKEQLFDQNYELRSNYIGDKLRKLKTNKKDILVFYYSGHGFVLKEETSLALPTKETILFKTIKKTLNKKNANFKLFVLDCCRSVVRLTTGDGPSDNIDEDLLRTNYQQLFSTKEKCSIVGLSCRPPEESYTTDGGSLFTSSFLSVLNREVEKEEIISGDATWCTILKDTAKKTNFKAGRKGGTQNPLCEHNGHHDEVKESNRKEREKRQFITQS